MKFIRIKWGIIIGDPHKIGIEVKFYKEILDKKLEKNILIGKNYHCHEWDKNSIEYFWEVQTSSIISEQFYPMEFWEDFVRWFISKAGKKINKICDVGCGNGNLIDILNKKFPDAEIIGLDLTESCLKAVRKRFQGKDKISFKVGNIANLSLRDYSMDLITVTEVLEHLSLNNFEEGFKEISKKLKPGGYLLASIPINEKLTFVNCPECGTIYQPYQHMIFEISYKDIEEICNKNGLSVVSFYWAFDSSLPEGNFIKKLLKKIMIKIFPQNILVRLFPKPGVRGFLAKK